MLRSDWLLVATLAGCLGLAEAGLYDAQHQARQPKDYGANACYNGSITAPLPSKPTDDSPAADASKQGRESRNDSKIGCDSLSAQAAVIQAKAAQTGLLISFSQTVLTFFALGAAVAAAVYAKGAAEQTARSAKAAENTLAHAQEVSEIQVRPYIHLKRCRLVENGRSFSVVLKIRNFGNVPADHVIITIGILPVELPITIVPTHHHRFQDMHVYPPGHTRTITIDGDSDIETVSTHVNEGWSVLVGVHISYPTAPRRPRTVEDLHMIFGAKEIARGKGRAVSPSDYWKAE